MRYAAEKCNLADSIAELREMAAGRDHVLAEAAGIEAGSWYAWPSTHVGHELTAAGMLIMAGRSNGTLDYGAGALDTGRLRAGYEIATPGAMIPNRVYFLTGNC
jgi:hypothetical protein